MTDIMNRITGLVSVAVPSTDLDRSLDFYVETLGLQKRRDDTLTAGFRWIEVAPEGAPTAIAVAPAGDAAPAGVDTGIRIAVTDAEASHAHLKAAGVPVDDILRWPNVPPMFSFRDPDGNTIYAIEQP